MNKYILLLIILLLFPINAIAISQTYYNGSCINGYADQGDIFSIVNRNATIGYGETYQVADSGILTNSHTRLNGANTPVCGMADFTSLVSGNVYRYFLTQLDGKVYYSDEISANISDGISPTQDIFLVDTITDLGNMKSTFDTDGNFYVAQAFTGGGFGIVSKYTKSSFYGKSIYVNASSCNAGSGAGFVIDMDFDSSGYMHVLARTTAPKLVHCVYSGGTTLLQEDDLTSSMVGLPTTIGSTGELILDSTNQLTNYTVIVYTDSGNNAFIRHNSSAGVTVIATETGGSNTVTGAAYRLNTIFVTFPDKNSIKTYTTPFTGQGITLPGSQPAQLTYSVSSVSSQQDTYANNSNVLIDVNVVVDNSALSVAEILLLQENQDYRWKTELNDPSGLLIATHFSGACLLSSFPYTTCSVNETLSISPPVTNWTNGTYTVYLKEYNVNTYALSTLDTDTFSVLNTSENNTGIVVTNPITSGSGTTAIGTVDNWTAMFGLGINAISKFMFAMMWIVFFMVVGAILLKGIEGGVIFGLFPYSFFVFIEYLPSWTVIILGIVIAIKLKLWR